MGACDGAADVGERLQQSVPKSERRRVSESKLQARVIKYAKSLGFLAKRNYNGPGVEVAWPDVEFFLPGGVVVLVEFKKPGGTLSKIQEYRIGELLERGHHVYVCDSFEYGKAIFDGYAARGTVT